MANTGLSTTVKRLARRLLGLPIAPAPDVGTLKIDPHNLPGLLAEGRSGLRVAELLVDINDTCNADCVYCPNGRSAARMPLEQFRAFLADVLGGVQSVQLGCGQEPTADRRLPSFLQALQDSPLRPREVRMITNGMLLHRFDPRALVASGLDVLQLSIDTVDAEVTRRIRIGTEVERILDNVRAFRAACPEVPVVFSVVVTSETIDGLDELVDGRRARRLALRLPRGVRRSLGRPAPRRLPRVARSALPAARRDGDARRADEPPPPPHAHDVPRCRRARHQPPERSDRRPRRLAGATSSGVPTRPIGVRASWGSRSAGTPALRGGRVRAPPSRSTARRRRRRRPTSRGARPAPSPDGRGLPSRCA